MGVIISALEVIEVRFGVVDVAAVAEGVIGTHGGGLGAGGAENVAPGIVGVGDNEACGFPGDGCRRGRFGAAHRSPPTVTSQLPP